MLDWSLIVAVLVVSLVGGAITGAVALAIGGLGATSVLRQRLAETSAAVERTDERITREVKKRAAEVGVEAREAKSAEAKAAEYLAEHGAQPGPQGVAARPSVLRG